MGRKFGILLLCVALLTACTDEGNGKEEFVVEIVEAEDVYFEEDEKPDRKDTPSVTVRISNTGDKPFHTGRIYWDISLDITGTKTGTFSYQDCQIDYDLKCGKEIQPGESSKETFLFDAFTYWVPFLDEPTNATLGLTGQLDEFDTVATTSIMVTDERSNLIGSFDSSSESIEAGNTLTLNGMLSNASPHTRFDKVTVRFVLKRTDVNYYDEQEAIDSEMFLGQLRDDSDIGGNDAAPVSIELPIPKKIPGGTYKIAADYFFSDELTLNISTATGYSAYYLEGKTNNIICAFDEYGDSYYKTSRTSVDSPWNHFGLSIYDQIGPDEYSDEWFYYEIQPGLIRLFMAFENSTDYYIQAKSYLGSFDTTYWAEYRGFDFQWGSTLPNLQGNGSGDCPDGIADSDDTSGNATDATEDTVYTRTVGFSSDDGYKRDVDWFRISIP